MPPSELRSALFALYHRTPVPMLVLDDAGSVTEASAAALELLGWTREALLGQPVATILTAPLPPAGAGSCPCNVRHRDGRLLPGRVVTQLLPDDFGQVLVLEPPTSGWDEHQHRAFRSAHLASLGELATGVAHEINNPINGIINYAQLLHDRLQADDRGSADLAERIMREGRRISRIVRNLLGLARSDGETQVPTAIADELEGVMSLLRAQLRKEHISLAVTVEEDPPPVLANPHQIQQVFLNVLHNARYALNQKYPENDAGKRLEVNLHTLRDGSGLLRVTVCDYGTGIPDDILGRIAEPFFTTKPFGFGTGLGLSICRDILADHGGRLLFESVEGVRTCVHIDLPTAAEG